jgi:hypothetical protein
MTNQTVKDQNLKAHMEALDKHRELLEKLHLNSDEHLNEIGGSLENITLTLEEYLKVLGLG